MDKIKILLKLSYKFSQKYIGQYLKELAKPIVYGLSGMFLFCMSTTFSFINPTIALFGLLSIPLLCYSIWKGYAITYGLIPCANNFIKNVSLPFENFSKQVKENEANLAKFVCFFAILTVICYLPGFLFIPQIPALGDLIYDIEGAAAILQKISNIVLIISLILSPFLNYALCSFYFKKEKENYFQLFLNCYKKLDLEGVLIAITITVFAIMFPVLYTILALFLNPFIYSINTFWYLSKIEK